MGVIGYCGDFVITGESKEFLAQKVKLLIRAILEKRGMTLSKEKTKITHIEDGFCIS